MMRANASLVAGVFLVIIGLAIVGAASPILIWLPIQISEYQFGFAIPHTWSMEHGPRTLPSLSLYSAQVDQAGSGPMSELILGPQADRSYYNALLGDLSGSAFIAVSAFPLDGQSYTAGQLSDAMERVHAMTKDNYISIYHRSVDINDIEGIQRFDTFTEECPDCTDPRPKRLFMVASYVVIGDYYYHFALVENDGKNLLRDYKVYRSILSSFNSFSGG